MADVRVTVGRRSHVPGTMVGMNLNTFGMERLESITGEDLAPIVEAALTPAFDQAHGDWPVLTGASRDSMAINLIEVGPRHARAALQVGGEQLINDARNVKHIDYAPFIEFNGTATAPAGILLYAMTVNHQEMRDAIHAGVAALIRERLGQ